MSVWKVPRGTWTALGSIGWSAGWAEREFFHQQGKREYVPQTTLFSQHFCLPLSPIYHRRARSFSDTQTACLCFCSTCAPSLHFPPSSVNFWCYTSPSDGQICCNCTFFQKCQVGCWYCYVLTCCVIYFLFLFLLSSCGQKPRSCFTPLPSIVLLMARVRFCCWCRVFG